MTVGNNMGIPIQQQQDHYNRLSTSKLRFFFHAVFFLVNGTIDTLCERALVHRVSPGTVY